MYGIGAESIYFCSVIGLSFDFLSLNLTGFICYAIFNCLIFWSTIVQVIDNWYRQLGQLWWVGASLVR